jgi:hypothetical protein
VNGELEIGAKVETLDGEWIGQVKAIGEAEFQVDAPRQLDYWLDKDIVKRASGGLVTLAIEKGALGAYKKGRPHDTEAFDAPLPAELDPDTVEGQRLLEGGTGLRP